MHSFKVSFTSIHRVCLNILDAVQHSGFSFAMASNRYCIDLAKRGTASCKECKAKIEKGVTRIAKIIPNPFTEGVGDMKQWFHVRCIFQKLSRARATTKKIDDTDDLEGWDELGDEHKGEVLQCLSEFSTAGPSKKRTPQKKKEKSPENLDVEAGPKSSLEHSEKNMDNSLRWFRKVVFKIAEESQYLGKSAIVSEFLKKGCDVESFKGNLYLWIKMLLPGVQKRVYNLQNKQLVKLFSQIFNENQDSMLTHFEENGDIADTVGEYFDLSSTFRPASKSTLYLQEVDEFLDDLSTHSKEAEQLHLLKKVAKKCTTNDLKLIIRFIKHDLRINAGPKHILDGVHPDAYNAFQASRDLKDVVQRVILHKESKDGKTAKLTVSSSVMVPVLPMLALACKSLEEPFIRYKNGFYVEVKYDGERVQLHKKGDEYSFFSRSLKPVMPHKVQHLKEFIPKALPYGNNLILDCEILLVDHSGKPLPFGTLGVHKRSAFEDACVCLFVFDCLQYNEENLMSKKLVERRKILEDNMQEVKNRVKFSEMKDVQSLSQLKKIVDSVFIQGLEGIIVKAKDSIYEPGKRHWLKLKKDYLAKGAMADCADLLVLGGYYGTGRRGEIMSVFLMGCLNTQIDKWCTVTKVNGGTDADLKRLNETLDVQRIGKDPSQVPSWLKINRTLVPDFIVKDPKKAPVWAICGAEFSRSEAHTANGISIRFPRIDKEKTESEKTWREAHNLHELQDLYEASKQHSEMVGLGNDDEDEDSKNESEKEEGFLFEENAEDEEEPKLKKTKEKKSPKKQSPKKSRDPSSETSPPKKSPKKSRDSSSERSPTKKQKKDDKQKKSPAKSKDSLPNVFTGVKLHIPTTVDDFELLRRYFVAFDGVHLTEFDNTQANHLLCPNELEESFIPPDCVKITVDWLWDCVKLQTKLSTHLYKPPSRYL